MVAQTVCTGIASERASTPLAFELGGCDRDDPTVAIENRAPAVAGADRRRELDIVGTFQAAESGDNTERDAATEAERRADGQHGVAQLWPERGSRKDGKADSDVDDGQVVALRDSSHGSLHGAIALSDLHGDIAGIPGLRDDMEVGDDVRPSRPGLHDPA